MTDQLIIGDKASFDDFEASMAARTIGTPKKKSIRETVPFSNVTYDFSKINGEIYWEDRELEYVFEIFASTPEKLEDLKSAFANWIMNVTDEDLLDPFIPDHHFRVTYDDMDFEDDEGMDKTTATVKFLAYPYKISNFQKVYEVFIPAGNFDEIFLTVVNESTHPIMPVFKTDTTLLVFPDEYTSIAFGEGVWENIVPLPVGTTVIKMQSADEEVMDNHVTLTFREEAL